MTIFNECCCCISLQMGGIILGVLGVIQSVAVTGILIQENSSEEGVTGFAILLIICLVNFCAAILLVIGAKTSRQGYILPYIITDGIGIITSILYFLVVGFYTGQALQGIFLAAVTLLLSGYFWLCILSLYQSIGDASRTATTIRSPNSELQAV